MPHARSVVVAVDIDATGAHDASGRVKALVGLRSPSRSGSASNLDVDPATLDRHRAYPKRNDRRCPGELRANDRQVSVDGLTAASCSLLPVTETSTYPFDRACDPRHEAQTHERHHL